MRAFGFLLVFLVPFLGLGLAQESAQDSTVYVMDSSFFSCQVPAGWDVERDRKSDEEYSIYEVEFIASADGAGSVRIRISYYTPESSDFADYKDFAWRNSRNVAGETKNAREMYAPIKKVEVAGRKAYELVNERMVFLHPESTSDESTQVNEKMYVLPSTRGFYVLRFTAGPGAYAQYVPVFEQVSRSLKARY